MNNNQFLVEDYVLDKAKSLCAEIKDDKLRNRAMVNAFAAMIAEKVFDDTELDIESGVYNIPKILEEYEIADIYVRENNYIDVRLCLEDGCLLVPKAHFESGNLPVAYMFITVDKELSSGIVAGFVLPENISRENSKGDYYVVTEDSLVTYYDIEAELSSGGFTSATEDFEKSLYDYFDGKTALTSDILKTLVASKDARILAYNLYKAQNVLSKVVFDDTAADQGALAEENEAADSTEEIISDSGADTIMADTLEEIAPLDNFDELNTDEPLSESIEEFGEVNELEPVELEEVVVDDLNAELPENEEITDNEILNEQVEEDELSVQDESADSDIVDLSGFEEETSYDIDAPDEANEVNEVIEDEIPQNEQQNDVADVEPIDNTTNEPEENVVSDFEYTTETTPSLDTIENSQVEDDNSTELTEEMLESSESAVSAAAAEQHAEGNEGEAQINELFGEEGTEPVAAVNMGKKKKSAMPLIGLLVILCAAGYFAYNKFSSQQMADTSAIPSSSYEEPAAPAETNKTEEDAMPVETVEKPQIPEKTNEGTSVSIPAIEQNLDASILVSNLTVNWEVPSGYASNNTAKRYLVKMGKILQLRLKTELLLLSKPPITNKIALELEYNKTSQRFDIKQLTLSSGEKSVDDIIKATVKGALDINLNMNMNVFENIQGNPVLIIKL